MDSPWAGVFLGVIAVTALLQAAFVAGLAVAAKKGGAKLAEIEKQFDAQVLSLAPRIVAIADKVAEGAGQVRRQAARTEGLVSEATGRVEKALVGARGRLIEAGERMDRKATDLEREELDPIRDRIQRVSAVARGVRRAIEVWRGDRDQRQSKVES